MQLIDTLIPVIALVRQTASAPAIAIKSSSAIAGSTALRVTPVVERHGNTSPFAPVPVTSRASQTTDLRPVAPASIASAVDAVEGPAAELPFDGPTQASALEATLDQYIETARQNARDNNVVPSDFETALFAVLAWADETLISAPWLGAPYWQRHLLQRHHFNTTTAGVLFFTKLDDLRGDQIEVREVYALCLAIGFKGRYAHEHLSRQLDERRRTTVQQTLEKNGLLAGADALLFPEAYQSTDLSERDAMRGEAAPRRNHLRLHRQAILGFGLPVLVLAVLYLTYHLIIIQMVNDILPKIQ